MNKRTKQWDRFRSAMIVMLIAAGLLMLPSCGSAGDPVITETAINSFSKTLVVATDDNYWPYVYYDENGRLTGHDVELISIVANELNMNLEIHP